MLPGFPKKGKPREEVLLSGYVVDILHGGEEGKVEIPQDAMSQCQAEY